MRLLAALVCSLLFTGCSMLKLRVGADSIYFNGEILTMAGKEPEYVEAIAVQGGRILVAGSLTQALATRDQHTRVCDLGGRTLMPGFVDPHSHIAGYEGGWGLPELQPPPVGTVRRIADIQRLLRDYITKQAIAPGELVMAQGYDDSLLEERRHPNRHDLDAVSTQHRIVILHASGHLAAVNTAALTAVGYTKDTPDPTGGLIRREADGQPDGVVEELAGLPFIALRQQPNMARRLQKFDEIQRYYASLGITTAHDGISMRTDLELLIEAARQERLILDIHSYVRWDEYPQALAEQEEDLLPIGEHIGRLHIRGLKLTGDGSPQGKTAFLTQPYVVPPSGMPADYRGYSTLSQEELNRWLAFAYSDDFQVIVHCNGDAAADQMIAAVRQAQAKYGRKDLRPVMIHAQMIRHDQVDAMAELGIIPSFFSAHTFYWGDWHIAETVGRDRAFGMSPAGYAYSKGMIFTNHTDAPVVPPNHFDAIWTAVQRKSRSGVVVGPDERIPVYAALQAVTLHAAFQHFEEREKGSIEVGKRADLIIVDRNPLTVDPDQLRKLTVLETIKDGRTIYLRP